MNSNAILSSDVLDILFEKRNKKYGAYILRKFYPDRVKTSLFIMLGMSAIFSAFTFLPATKPGSANRGEDVVLLTKTVKMQDAEQPKKEPAPQKKQAPQQQLTDAFKVVKNTELSTEFNDLDKLAIGTSTDTAGMSDGTTNLVPGKDPEPAAPEVTPPPAPDINIPVADPDVAPSFPGGDKELIDFLQRNLQSPEDISDPVQVRIKFVVGFDGHLESFDILQDGGESFNKEVIRVLKKMPQWNPGKKDGRNVKAYYYLPVKFAPIE